MGHWYSDLDKPVMIDKHRAWTSRVSIIEGYLHIEPKIIVTVRRVDEILTSILKMIHRNPFKEGQSRINFVDEFLVRFSKLILEFRQKSDKNLRIRTNIFEF